MSNNHPKIAVAGAGITGLAAAFYLQEKFQKKNQHVQITIIDPQSNPGGKIQTIRKDGFVIERGPDSFLARKLSMVQLANDLGIDHELVGLNPNVGSASILHDGEFHPIPKGFVLGVPTQIEPLMETGLLSMEGKIRALKDLLLPADDTYEDESLGEFLRRRLGEEIVMNIAEPLLSGIYAGNLYDLSTTATFPQFKTLAQKHRSLILGMRESLAAPRNAVKLPLPPELKSSMFLHFRHGLSTLIEALVDRLKEQRFMLNTSVRTITKENSRYQLTLSSGEVLDADAVILAVPPFHAASMLQQTNLKDKLSEIKHVSVANVALGFYTKPEADWRGTGFLIPRNEETFMTACTFTSDKWPHTAPEQSALLRCYVGRSDDASWQKLTDDEIINKVRDELSKLIGLQASPDFSYVTRWNDAMPQYTPGHIERVEEIKSEAAKQFPGVFIAGGAYNGVGLPDCVRQGAETADLMEDYLKNMKN